MSVILHELPYHKTNAKLAMQDRYSKPAPKAWLHSTYEEFCRFLVEKFGQEYLHRPDGEPLEPRRAE